MLSEVLLHPISHEDRYNLLNSLLYNDIELERHLVILETIATKLYINEVICDTFIKSSFSVSLFLFFYNFVVDISKQIIGCHLYSFLIILSQHRFNAQRYKRLSKYKPICNHNPDKIINCT